MKKWDYVYTFFTHSLFWSSWNLLHTGLVSPWVSIANEVMHLLCNSCDAAKDFFKNIICFRNIFLDKNLDQQMLFEVRQGLWPANLSILLCILNSFWVLHALKSWLKHFFWLFSIFFVLIFDFFKSQFWPAFGACSTQSTGQNIYTEFHLLITN